MKRALLAVLAWCVSPAVSAAELRVLAATPDLASLAREVGGERVKVQTLASPLQSPHQVEPKPSLVVKLMRTDVVILTGLELEIAWLSSLIQSSRNKKIQPGAVGYIDVSEAINPLEIPRNVSRAGGDIHPGGNPHYLTDPENARLAAAFIARRLGELAPEDAGRFEAAAAAFDKKLVKKIADWKEALGPFRGTKFVSYHRDWIYFAARFGLVSVGEIEPKPGIPPTGAHTSELVDRMKAEGARLVLTDPWYEDRTARSVAQQTAAALLRLAMMPGAEPGTEDYIATVDYNVKLIREALRPRP